MTDDTGPAGELRYRIPKGGEWIVYEWRRPGFVDRVSDELSRETRGRRTKEADNQCSSEAETAKLVPRWVIWPVETEICCLETLISAGG